MKTRIGKLILIGYAFTWFVWLSWVPTSGISPAAETGETPYADSAMKEGNQSPSAPDTSSEECQRCHAHPERLKLAIKDPACLECHMPDDERIRPEKNAGVVGTAVPVKLDSPVKPNQMIHIPAGVFLMGRTERTSVEGAGNNDETPEHKVYVTGFYMDKYEVTNIQYREFVDATGIAPPRHWKGGRIPPGKDNHPVNYVSWFEANDYCHWVGKRLPTEAEWEKAARGPKGLRFPWGDTFDPMKANTPQHWLALQKEGDTMPVGSFENGKSPYGLYDMAGNLYEWTSSWYKPYPNNNEPNAHYGYKNKIVRGGSWYDCLSYGCGLSAPTFNRSRFAPIIRNKSFGFRCAKSE